MQFPWLEQINNWTMCVFILAFFAFMITKVVAKSTENNAKEDARLALKSEHLTEWQRKIEDRERSVKYSEERLKEEVQRRMK